MWGEWQAVQLELTLGHRVMIGKAELAPHIRVAFVTDRFGGGCSCATGHARAITVETRPAEAKLYGGRVSPPESE